MDYIGDDGDDAEQQLLPDYDANDERTNLDKTIDRIGMGSYQWTLLSMCGFGWMADNMWIQAVAIILPRVQQHYDVPDSYIGTVSSAMFAGMMFGAVGWGTCSDLMGRSTAFNATLFFTSVFGLLASFANSFPSLCVLLFCLGSSVGGSMPTDGTLLLEHMPQGKQYLVTALSVFFSLGSVLAAVVALAIVPQHSCHVNTATCDVQTENLGWKYMLIALGLITLSMFLARIVFFRLHESPRYLVHAGRPQEAIESLQLISRFNGSEFSIDLEDVDDHRPGAGLKSTEDNGAQASRLAPEDDTTALKMSESPTNIIFDADAPVAAVRPPLGTQTSSELLRPGVQTIVQDYRSTGESVAPLEPNALSILAEPSQLSNRPIYTNITPHTVTDFPEAQPHSSARARSSSPQNVRFPRPRLSLTTRQSRMSTASLRSSRSSLRKRVGGAFPRWIRRPLRAWLDRVSMVLEPEWRRTTLLVWGAWCSMALAYTMFNVFLPKLLESATAKTLEESLWDVVIFTIGGCPGAILGAYMVESNLGRRGSLAGSTFITAFFCVVFVMVESAWAVRLSTIGISLSATTMWAVLYGWTPEIFGTKVRGTACGIASALSRIGGMIAPMLGGILLEIDRSVPVYTSVVIFVIAGVFVLLLKENGGERGKEDVVIVH